MVRGGAWLALTLAVALLAVPAQGLGCDPAEFVKGVANISTLQISSGLLASSVSTIGGPNNSAVFLPTDAAWEAFRKTNGAKAPDANRSVAILLYNSIVTYGQASEATLVSASPIQTSASDLVSAYEMHILGDANAKPALPLKFSTVNGVTMATDVGNHTVSFNGSYHFCNQQVYSTNGVLLPAASYAQVPETYLIDIAALIALANAPVGAPVPASGPAPEPTSAPAPVPATAPAPATAPSPSNAPVPSPSTAPGTSASTSPAPTPASSPTASPTPAPAPSGSPPAFAVPISIVSGVLAAGLLLVLV